MQNVTKTCTNVRLLDPLKSNQNAISSSRRRQPTSYRLLFFCLKTKKHRPQTNKDDENKYFFTLENQSEKRLCRKLKTLPMSAKILRVATPCNFCLSFLAFLSSLFLSMRFRLSSTTTPPFSVGNFRRALEVYSFDRRACPPTQSSFYHFPSANVCKNLISQYIV